jgi:alkylation response protein AidB-like acyl-CoA dehydrogenase
MDKSELLELRNAVKKIAQSVIPKYLTEENYGTVPRNLFKELSEQGLSGMGVPESLGGTNLSPLAVAVTFEELAKEDAGVSIFMSVHYMVTGLINRFASQKLKEQYLPKLASGEYLGAFALTEPGAGSDASALSTKAIRTDGGYHLNGEKCYITSAGYADLYIVFAKTDPNAGKDGISAFIVRADTNGLTIGKSEKKMGAELSPIASLNFSNAFVPDDHLVGELNKGYKVALGGLAGGRINIAACALGIAYSALDKAIKHTAERKQFGHKISEFQGVQFMLADMKMKLDASGLLTYRAASELSNNPDARTVRINSSMAKCFTTDMAMQITTDAVQLLGGAGYIKEYGVEKLMRDAKMLQIVEGTNQIQRALIAKELLSGY